MLSFPRKVATMLSSMEWEPEQYLGGLGLAGICREILRVLRARCWSLALVIVVLCALLLAHAAVSRALFFRAASDVDDAAVAVSLARVVVDWAASCLFEASCLLALLALSLFCTAASVFYVAALYCADGASRAAALVLRDPPAAPLSRLTYTFCLAAALLLGYAYVFRVADFLGLQLLVLDAPDAIALPLQLLAGAAYLAGMVSLSVVCHLAWVASVLEDDATGFCAMRRSRALLAGKLWPAAAIFTVLDGCFLALQVAFPALVVEDTMGLSVGLRVAAGVAMAAALYAVVAATLVAQPVVYLVCKSYHHEVVDAANLAYVGEYKRLDDNGNNGVELQSVQTEQELTATA